MATNSCLARIKKAGPDEGLADWNTAEVGATGFPPIRSRDNYVMALPWQNLSNHSAVRLP